MSAPRRAGDSGLTVTHLAVTYPGAASPAVRDASLHVPVGGTVALVGPSGCGKSTLLAAIVGIVAPTAGSILFDGIDIDAVPIHRRGFGLVFQDGQLFPHRTVEGNVGFGLEMARMPSRQRAVRIAQLLDTVGLAGFGPRPVSELSGGERQRVALARSLAPGPRLLLLDEPLSSLDADLRLRLGSEVRDILKATGTTAVLVTHDAEEAHRMCDTTVYMADGLVPALAPVPALRAAD